MLAIIDFGVIRDFSQVSAHQSEVMMFIHLTYRANACHDILVAQLAAQRITRIGRINDNTARPHNGGRLSYQAQLRVIGMDGKELSHVKRF